MDDSTNPELVVQLKQACQRLSRGIHEPISDLHDEYRILKNCKIVDILKEVTALLRTGCGGHNSPSRVLGWSDDFHQCMNLLCFERYVCYSIYICD